MHIQSLGDVVGSSDAWTPSNAYGSLWMYDQYRYDYATMYRTQPAVRTCVEFLARNIAQLGLHVFRRVSNTDRVRLTDHPLALLLGKPLPEECKVTRYKLIEALVGDLGIYHNAYWLKIRGDSGVSGLLRIPPHIILTKGGLAVEEYRIDLTTKTIVLPPEEIVHFRGYNPQSATIGLSPLETLRRILAEEHASGQYREGFWKNAARMHGVVSRPANAPEWSADARARFKLEFEELYTGNPNSGKTAILEEGMTWQQVEFNAQESEWLSGRKLTREETTRAFHIPLPMAGILDYATYSNIKEQHKNLYQDCLGPWLKMIEEDIELQLLPEFDDTAGVYVEFNIAEKMSGSFEEQTQALQSAVGRPWMTANEARARLNLPSLDGDADELVTPLNVLIGGQASPRDSAPPKSAEHHHNAKARLDSHYGTMRETHQNRWAVALSKHYQRQEAAVASRMPKAAKGDIGGIWWDDDRWNNELHSDLFRLNVMTAKAWASYMADMIGTTVQEDMMLPWLDEHSRIQAEYLNATVRDAVAGALQDPEPASAVKRVFELAVSVWAVREAVSAVTSAASFGSSEAARAGGLKTKTWKVNSSSPRASHSAMNGETVPIDSRFSNGMRWPGDPVGGAENNANCQCSVVFGA